jgi:hypothetical protein
MTPFFRPAVVWAAVVLSACFLPPHIAARRLNPAVRRARLCRDAVRVFNDSSEVGKHYEEVAHLFAPPGGFEYHPPPEDIVWAEQKKAAKLGANAIVVLHGVRSRDGLYDDAMAIFIPEDSAHSVVVCASTHPGRSP